MPQATVSQNRDLDLKYLWHGNTQHRGLEARPPLEIAAAEGCYVFDADGRRYLDGMAGLFCVNVGYGRRAIVDAVAAQMAQLAYYPLTQSHGPGAQLAARLAGMLPKGLSRVFFSNSGSEAVETALKMARQCARLMHPGENRYKIIARHRGYHGFTMGGLSATGQTARRTAFEPLVPGFLHVAPPDHYRCGFCSTQPACTLGCADEIERVIRMEGPDTVAAVIAEPVIGGGGIFPAPDGYFERLRATCDKYGVLLIADEVITGFGRTGKLFGFEHSAIQPDILTFAKGLTSAYLPLGATVASERIFDAFHGDSNGDAKFTQVSTFGGHPELLRRGPGEFGNSDAGTPVGECRRGGRLPDGEAARHPLAMDRRDSRARPVDRNRAGYRRREDAILRSADDEIAARDSRGGRAAGPQQRYSPRLLQRDHDFAAADSHACAS